jgi:hypothetical protein
VDHRIQALDVDFSIELREPYLSTLQPRLSKMPQGEGNYPREKFPDADSPEFAPVARFDYLRVWQRVPQPQLEFVEPQNGAAVRANRVTLLAAAKPSHAGNPVTKVEFYEEVLKYWPEKPLSQVLEKKLLGSVDGPPYKLRWDGCPSGFHAVRAIAYARDGSLAETRRICFEAKD